jgi:DNA mismatch repair protein MutS
LTPIRRQYLDVKKRYPHAIVFFRLGDFYETFDEDARLVARELEITLTSKPMGKNLRVPLAGIPYHSLNSHLSRLLARGYRVAICEQMEEAKAARGLVSREVVRLLTPGTVNDGALLTPSANNYLVAIKPANQAAAEAPSFGLAWLDVSTGAFGATELNAGELEAELARLSPVELLLPQGMAAAAVVGQRFAGLATSTVSASEFDPDLAVERLCERFSVATLAGFGLTSLPLATAAAAALLAYARENMKGELGQLQPPRVYSSVDHLAIDAATLRNLEIAPDARGRPSLFSVLDVTCTAAGARTLRSWLVRPLLEPGGIDARLDRVQALRDDVIRRDRLRALLRRLPDLERLTVRVGSLSARPRELAGLRDALVLLPELHAELAGDGPLAELGRGLNRHGELAAVLTSALADEPAVDFDQGPVIRAGFSAELDALRQTATNARALLAQLEAREREASGIRSLKLGYNRVFGYYLEVSTANQHLVPDSWQRRQTLTGGERYVTAELKELEEAILGAGERVESLQREVFRGLCATVAAHAPQLLDSARVLAEVDVYAAAAVLAAERNYCRPVVDDSSRMEIREGRHPVVEATLSATRFVGNDLELDSDDQQVLVLTGPNMAGKSTYLRQAALIVVMAQAGLFVPAAEARIGIVDRLFARVGAHDDLARGESTFMVEMVETAAMLNQATARSLLVFDEIGRGTSTYDGISIARAVIEHLHASSERPRTLFATHYHELTELATELPRVRNYQVAVSEEGEEVVFLHRILAGRADRSYGIHVARLAGLPPGVLARASTVLGELEAARAAAPVDERKSGQLQLLPSVSPLVAELALCPVEEMTPLQALVRIDELRARARSELEG